ncbi:MAG: hypothetical protein GY861_00290 [bacterium]|nr:hypothetical protein [bacterium]
MKNELLAIQKLYKLYQENTTRKKNLLHNSVDIYYLDGYNIKRHYSSDRAITAV